MNNKLKEINDIIYLCDLMIEYISKNGLIYPRNDVYNEYKKKIDCFCENNSLKRKDYAPYQVLSQFYYKETTSYTINLSEAMMIRRTIVEMKHELFSNCYEKIFISHREKDKKSVEAFVELLHSIGIPRPTEKNPESVIFCTSHPESYILNGEKNLEEIRDHLNSDKHIFYILWYSDNYFESQACLNEAGAIWALKRNYQEILSPQFDNKKIGGLLDKQPVWFRSNDAERLNIFKEQLEKMFELDKLSINAWETARNKFINTIN